MRIVVVSDTHRNTALLHRCVRQAIADGPIDVFLHCGDGVRDLESVENDLLKANPRIRIVAVRGNCDLGAFSWPDSEIIDLNGIRAFVTHGHLYQVKHGQGHLARAARELQATLAFFGHTHQAAVSEKHGVTLINPGSLSSQALSDIAYLEVRIDSNQPIRVNFMSFR